MLFCASLVTTPAALAGELRVEINAARSTNGLVHVAVYDQASAWLKDGMAVRSASVKPDAQRHASVVFKDLPPGRYAVSGFHDENANGQLDANFFGLPTEPYGFSRNAKGRMGPPQFDASEMELTENGSLSTEIVLR